LTDVFFFAVCLSVFVWSGRGGVVVVVVVV